MSTPTQEHRELALGVWVAISQDCHRDDAAQLIADHEAKVTAELRAEVERLRASYRVLVDLVESYSMVKDVDVDWDKFPEETLAMAHQEINELRAEVASLRKENLRYENDAYYSECDRLRAEVAALRRDAETRRTEHNAIVASMRAETEKVNQINHNSSLDWADDHTHLQNLCREAGIPEEDILGDSYGVPGIMELADMLAAKVAALREDIARIRGVADCDTSTLVRLERIKVLADAALGVAKWEKL